MKTIAVIAAPGFEEIELNAPVDILRRLGHRVLVAGLKSLVIQGAHEVSLQTDTTMDQIDPEQIDALVLPGGQGSWVLRDTPEVIDLIQKTYAKGKLVAAICAAPIALAKAGIIAGKNVTAYPAGPVYEDLKDSIIHKDKMVVQDGTIITGMAPAAALEFGFAIAANLSTPEAVADERKAMCMPD